MDQPTFVGMFTKDEATAAERTFSFLAVDVTDGFTPETGLTYAGADCQISKNGGAQGNLAGAVTEIAAGLYKVVLAAGDVDTLGTFVISFADAAARTTYVQGQVVALDLNVATVNPGADGITAATIAADVVTELQAGLATAAAVEAITLATRTVTKSLGTVTDTAGDGADNDDGDLVATSTLDAIDVTFELSGTFGGATATVQTTQDPAAAVPVWTDYDDTANDNPLTAAGSVIVAGGGHAAARVLFSSTSGTTDIDITAVIRKPANT